MANTDLELFMWKLKQLIDGDRNSLIRSNPYIRQKLPEIKVLYEEFGKLIESGMMNMDDEQVLHVYELDEEYVRKWKKRVVDVAHEAQDMVDVFISSAILMEKEVSKSQVLLEEIDDMTLPMYDTEYGIHDIRSGRFLCPDVRDDMEDSDDTFLGDVIDCPLDLKDVIDDIKSLENELKVQTVQKEMKLEYSSTRNTARVLRHTGIEREEVMVGLDEQALLIIDKLAEDRKHKQLEIISIVGMGGLGKTTLATKIFNHHYVVHCFGIRGWVTVSQAYTKRDLLKGILESIGKSAHEAISEPMLRKMLHQSLYGRKYFIVIDDIWSGKAWNDLRLYFPDDNTGSRILVTTRQTEVASHASPGGFIHNLRYLTEEESWELLCRKAFRGYECPESLIETGKQIAKKCKGLPLALVVIAGLLEKGEKNKHLWEKVAESVSSYVINDPNGCLDTLALSYDHLPHHLRNCFLYAGGFPEDYKIQVKRLIRLWMAEGFIVETGQRSLEEEAEDYLMDLVDRNLLIVADRRSDGGIKSCRLHDLLRELCLKKATEDNFFKKIGESDRYPFSDSNSRIEKHRRLFADYEVLCEIYSHGSLKHIRSLFCFSNREPFSFRTGSWAPSFLLLRVLDLLNSSVTNLSNIKVLIHLRYLAVWLGYREKLFPLGDLRSLETLILKGKYEGSLEFKDVVNNMVHLRHLRSENLIKIISRINLPFPNIKKSENLSYIPMFRTVLSNLQSISRLNLPSEHQRLLLSFPNIKKLACSVRLPLTLNFAALTRLESLDVDTEYQMVIMEKPIMIFPETLKKLTLRKCGLRWNFMSVIQQLPKLEVLKLLDSSFIGWVWNTGEEEFRQLKFLKLRKLDIRSWVASNINFPQLRKLVVRACIDLKEIPLDIGDIYTLQHIEIDRSNPRLLESVNSIQEEQRALGNDGIHVKVTDNPDPDAVFFEGNPYAG